MTNKYAIKITDFYDTTGKGVDAYSYWYISDTNDEDETKVVLFDSESEANDFIKNSFYAYAEAVIYSEMILNKKELIDFIGKANDQLVLQDIVKQFCKSINLELEITYKYALYLNFVNRNNDVVKKHNQLYTKNNNVVLFDTPEKAKVIADFIYDDTDDTWADVVPYQRIIKYDDTTTVYDIYERQDY